MIIDDELKSALKSLGYEVEDKSQEDGPSYTKATKGRATIDLMKSVQLDALTIDQVMEKCK